jgi:hypothetical protein
MRLGSPGRSAASALGAAENRTARERAGVQVRYGSIDVALRGARCDDAQRVCAQHGDGAEDVAGCGLSQRPLDTARLAIPAGSDSQYSTVQSVQYSAVSLGLCISTSDGLDSTPLEFRTNQEA